jgi:hypothetical protein
VTFGINLASGMVRKGMAPILDEMGVRTVEDQQVKEAQL